MPKKNKFKVKIVREGVKTDDGRFFLPGSITWPDEENFPLPLLYLDKKTAEGHTGAQVGGYIDRVWKEDSDIYGEGTFAPGEYGEYLRDQVDAGLQGVSADMVDIDFIMTAEDDGTPLRVYTKGKLRGATVLPIPAFDSTRINVVASAIPVAPPKSWFEPPKLNQPTMFTVTKEGRVFGHVACWGTCHVGYQNQCVTPPRSQTNYAKFNSRPVLTQEGDEIFAGVLTFGVGHAPIMASAEEVRHHYDDVGTQIAQVRVGEDEHGIWMAGAINPDIDEITLRKLRASAVSGDWRQGELKHILCVNTPGFDVPRVQAHFQNDQQVALVAAGVLVEDPKGEEMGNPEEKEVSQDVNVEEASAQVEQESEKVDVDSEKEESEKDLSFEDIIADFAAQLETVAEKDPGNSAISQELLKTLSEKFMPQGEAAAEEDDESNDLSIDERLSTIETTLVKIGNFLYKK